MGRLGRWVVALCVAAAAIGVRHDRVRADVPQVPTGTWAADGAFAAIPRDAASAVLPDGRLVVSGGSDDQRQPVALIATYDPSSGTWQQAGQMSVGRAGHTLTALSDGRLLIAGGRTADGLTDSTELYDLTTAGSTATGALSRPRADHAAARLADDRVLIVGGWDGTAVVTMAEVFDPATGSISQLPTSLSTARTKLSATTLLDGHVLVAGGHDGTNDLSSAEIFDPATASFFNTGAMQVARSGHVAVLLPNNNQVLIAGGLSAGAAVASAELYADWRDGFSATTPMSAPRAGAIGAGLLRHEAAFVAGGGANTAEYYGYATLVTDKNDYAPYETVTISGSGWQPGETVHLRISEDADTHYDWELEAIADDLGNIINREFYPRNDEVYHHVGMRFYVSAVGIASQALATFTDASHTNTSLSSSANPSTAGQNVTFTATIRGGNTQGSGPLVTEGSVNFYDQTTAQKNDCSKNGILLGSQPVSASGQASLQVAFPSGGTYPIQACYIGTHGQGTQDSTSPQIAQTVNSVTANTTTTASNAAATVSASNQDVTLSATVTSTNTVNAGSVTFTVKNGAVTIGSPVVAPVNSGSASQTFVLPANTPAGTYSIQAAYSGATDFNSSSDITKTLTVGLGTQAAVTVSAPASATYQQTGLSAVASGGSGTGAYSYSHGASTACTVNSATGALTITSGTGTCAITASRAGDASYHASAASAPASVTIERAPASISANNKSKTYGQANPVLDAVVEGAVNGDTLAYSLATAADETSGVGSYSIVVTPGSNPNYAVTKHDGSLTIGPATASVTANAKSKTYGDDNPALDAVVVGAINGDTLAYSLATTALQFSGVGSYPIEVTLGLNSNYTVSKVDAALTVNPALATVSANAKSKTYGDDNPALDAEVAGAVNGDTLAYSLATTALQFSGVGSYPIEVTLGLNPNYTVSKVDAALTVNPALASVTATAKSKTYGDDNPALDAVVVGAVNGDTLGYSLATTALKFSGVGGYPIEVTLGLNPNYTVTPTNGTLTVVARAATVKANDKGKTYGDANPVLDATVSGTVNGDVLNYTLATAADATSGVGSYPISVSLGTNSNYTVTPSNGTLTIGKRTLTVTPDGGKTKILGEVFTAFTGSVDGLQGTDTGAATYASLGAAAGATVGSYDITATFTFSTGAQSNYDVQLNTAVKGLVVLYRWDGFLQPINDTAHDLGPMSKFKAGQTIPAKFVLKNAAGATVQQTGLPTFTRTAALGTCDSASALENPEPVPASVVPQYFWDGAQYHYNWSTKGLQAGLYRIFATIADGTVHSVDICLTR